MPPSSEPIPPSQVISDAGGCVAIGRELGITKQAVSLWEKPPMGRRPQIPSDRVLFLEKRSGHSRYRIRPDIYGPDPSLAKRSPERRRRPAKARR